MEKFGIFLQKENIEIAGETSGGVFSNGKCNIYQIESESGSWRLDLAHTFWENGEEDIAAKNVFPDKLNLIKNRLRMVINKCELVEYPETKIATLRMAVLKNEGLNEWSNLKTASTGELGELIGGNILNYFKRLGAKNLDYKIDIFNQTGSAANQLAVIFPKDNTDVPIHAFVITRVLPILYQDNVA